MINFNEAFFTQNTLTYIADVLSRKHSSGDGKYTKMCHAWLEEHIPVQKSLLVHSGTAALEMQALLADIGPGDEVIMPSFTFVSTANAYVLRGATPVFIDIRPDTLNMDENLIEDAITERTRAIAPIHYAGVSCEMDAIMATAARHDLLVLEDAAQGFGSSYKGKPLGTIGDLGAISFHETKNIMSGEGGALFINRERFNERAEIIREKGTNRSRFFRGQVDKYTWVDVGSSYLPSDIIAAYLYSALELCSEVSHVRVKLWDNYQNAFARHEAAGTVLCPKIPDECQHNGHIYYLRFDSLATRERFIAHMKGHGIMSPFHYIPLHSSPAGRQFGRSCGDMPVTEQVSDTLVRLPLYFGLEAEMQQRIIDTANDFLDKC